jgi:hypothetical protein
VDHACLLRPHGLLVQGMCDCMLYLLLAAIDPLGQVRPHHLRKLVNLMVCLHCEAVGCEAACEASQTKWTFENSHENYHTLKGAAIQLPFRVPEGRVYKFTSL